MTTRILHLIKGLGQGGAEQLLVNHAGVAGDPEQEFQVAHLLSEGNHVVEELQGRGWPVTCLRGDRVWDLRWAARLRKLIKGERIDVVHGHSPLVAAISRVVVKTVPRDRRPAMVYTEHNEWTRHHVATRTLNRLTIRFEDHVLAVSEAVKNTMSDGSRVEVLLHGIDVATVAENRSFRDEVRAELGIGPDDVVIGTVANYRREKAYEVLLEAAKSVVASNPHVRFVSVGHGPLADEIGALHEASGLGDSFKLLGYREDAVRVMSAFDIFTLASRHEGLPVSLMEALALGLPVVATAVGGIPDAVGGHDGAALVAPGDPNALATAYEAMVERVIKGQRRGPVVSMDADVAAARIAQIYRGVHSARR